jgi:membrane-bound inhibitor of C-type lysozyme
MNAFSRVMTSPVLAALAAGSVVGLAAGSALAQPPPAPAAGAQPPMNDFYQAFYRCDGGGAFSLTYDSDQPTKVELAANDGSKPVELKRATTASGFEFTAGGSKFWTDGKSVKVEDAKGALNNCKMKAK